MPGPQHGFSEDLAGDPGSPVASPKTTGRWLPRNNLPLELSSFVGRGREIAEIEGLLADNRLLTLAGPGGSGKTRLALRVAAEAAESIEDGVWMVELAPLSDPDLVSQAFASVLGVRETPGTALVDSLCDHLASKEMLLVLEQLRAPHRRLRLARGGVAALVPWTANPRDQPGGSRGGG